MLRDFNNELVHFILDVFTFNQATKTSSKFKIIYKFFPKNVWFNANIYSQTVAADIAVMIYTTCLIINIIVFVLKTKSITTSCIIILLLSRDNTVDNFVNYSNYGQNYYHHFL